MLQEVRGTKDILPNSIASWQYLEENIRIVTNRFGYKELRTPIFENTEVFSRSIGDNTDIVNKEMYTFEDRGGNSLTLRPEMTAALVRSVIQNGLTAQGAIARLWYFGPFFRYERPQKGRYRQFHQFGAECLSSPYPESDVETILLACGLTKQLGIKNFKLQLNSLGNKISRQNFQDDLVKFLNSKKMILSDESKFRLEKNPLRVLDSKDQRDIDATLEAPSILEFLDEESSLHFGTVKLLLNQVGIDYVINPRLVRGLDYYSHTVFEFQSSALGSQDAFGGGGRYNDLFEQLGGKATPAVGFAMGVERLLLILEASKLLPENEAGVDAYIITFDSNNNGLVLSLSDKLRNAGFSVKTDISRKSFKSQMKDANNSNAKFAIILGDNEIERNVVQVKNMQSGEQKEVNIENILKFMEI